MAKAAALVITGISIALLVIYGADAAAGMDDPDHQGFLDILAYLFFRVRLKHCIR